MLVFSLVGACSLTRSCGCSTCLPLNPQGLRRVTPDLAFNTAVSFTTNTNWQSYGGESTMSYFSQMVGLTLHNFASAAVGIAIAAALVRGVARHSAKTLGNFWVDLVRVTYYLLLPVCAGVRVVPRIAREIQNFRPYTKARMLEPPKDRKSKRRMNKGETIKGPDGKPVMEEHIVTRADHPPGAHGFAGGDQDARHERRRLHELERGASVRESNATSEFLQMLSIFASAAG